MTPMKYPLLDSFQDPFTSREKGGKRLRRERAAAIKDLRG